MSSAVTVAELNILCKSRHFHEALAAAQSLSQQGIAIPRHVIYSLLQGFSKQDDLNPAKQIHALMIKNKFHKISALGDHLIRLYVSCRSLIDAYQTFVNIPKPTIYTWNAILTAHSSLGNEEGAFKLFCQMQQRNVKTDRVTLLCMLKACISTGDISNGRLIHHGLITDDFGSDKILGSSLIDLYAKHSFLEDSRIIFDKLPERDIVAWGAIISGYAQHGSGFITLEMFEKMQKEGIQPNAVVFASVLKGCSTIEATEQGMILHSHVIEYRLESDNIVSGSLINMYSKWKCLDEASTLLKCIPNRDSVIWGTILEGYSRCGNDEVVLSMFHEMLLDGGVVPSKPMLLCVLKAAANTGNLMCSSFLYDQIIRIGSDRDLTIVNTVIDVYGKCGAVHEACNVFDRLRNRDIVSWSALMGGYAQQGDHSYTMRIFLEMQKEKLTLDRTVFLHILKACNAIQNVVQGMIIHGEIIEYGHDGDSVLGNALIDMYSKNGMMKEAHNMFDKLEVQDNISWGTLLSGYSQEGNNGAIIEIVQRMLDAGFEPCKVVFLSSLKACGILKGWFEGRLLHDQIVRAGMTFDVEIGSSLIDMYACIGCLEEAIFVFDEFSAHDIVTWTSIISACANHGNRNLLLELFEKMQQEGIKPNEGILFCIIKACGGINTVDQVRLIHHQILVDGLESDISMGSFLIGMYARWRNLKETNQLFSLLLQQDEKTWEAFVAGPMPESGRMPCSAMFVHVLKACSAIRSLTQGMLLHYHIISTGLDKDLSVGNAVIDLYVKCGNLDEARDVFESLPSRDLEAYSSIITGLVNLDDCTSAFELYMELQQDGIKPDRSMLQCILKVCGTLGAIRQGMLIHDTVVRDDVQLDEGIRSALLNMYASCARLEEAHKVFDEVSVHDTMSWGAMVAAHAQHGDYQWVIQSIPEMESQGVCPNHRMFSSILATCSHAGLLSEGYHCFSSMKEVYSITPTIEHLNCMIDLFGRTGHLNEAVEFLKSMPHNTDIVGLRSLLAGCRLYGNSKLGGQFFDRVLNIQSNDASGFILMSQMLAEAYRWDMSNWKQLAGFAGSKSINSANHKTMSWYNLKGENKMLSPTTKCKDVIFNSVKINNINYGCSQLSNSNLVAQSKGAVDD